MRLKNQPELLSSADAAEYLGLAGPGVLAVWRSCKIGYSFPYIRVGGKILYDVEDLRAFLESRKVVGTRGSSNLKQKGPSR